LFTLNFNNEGQTKKPSLAAQRIRLAIFVAQRRRHGRAATNAPSTSGSHQLTVSPRQSIASPRRRKLASHSNAPSTSRSQQSVESPSPPHNHHYTTLPHGGSTSLHR
ncbi:hypothetical protein Tco_1270837, partial [Tanacetum coccineum]